MRRLVLSLAGLLIAGPALAQAGSPMPAEPPQNHRWSFDGPFGTFDRASAQRGFEVYQKVCSNCHSMNLLYYRNLEAIGFTPAEVKAIAASVQVPGGVDDSGQPIERPGRPSDRFRAPFPNDKAAAAANGGAVPPDQSLLVNAREDGPNYIYSLLNGYRTPPKGMDMAPGKFYNIYFPGRQIGMPPPLQNGSVTYADGTPATVEQEARDVVQFLTWAANPDMEQRKRMGVKVALYLVFMTGLTIAVKKKIWKDVH